ncbi:MAG: hypothetical protein ACO1NO_09925 [Burkholderiaceae bacterium]
MEWQANGWARFAESPWIGKLVGSVHAGDSSITVKAMMRSIFFTAAVLLFITSGLVIPAERQCPTTIHNSYQCSQYLERELAKEYPTLFSRQAQQLTISLLNGRKKTYTDIPDAPNYGANGKWFTLVQYYPEIGYALLGVQYYEGDTYYLVNLKTGEETNIVSYPVLSPDRKRIAVANVDIVSGYTPDFLAVYELQPSGLKTEFYAKPDDWGADSVRWVSNDEISFIQYRLNPNYDAAESEQLLLEAPKTLKRTAGKWRIEE